MPSTRGIETITYIIEGLVEHGDSMGNRGVIGAGDVQWMTAGSGIVHSERTEPEMRATGFRMHGVQTWVALPKTHEETAPAFEHVEKARLPAWSEGGADGRDPARFSGKGAGFGFVVQTEDSPVKISDVMVAEWNGMPDSARSLQIDDQDIVLLTNGTDRFSGKVGGMRDGKVALDGKYGRFQFQLDDIAEIRFARNGLAKESEPVADNLIIRLSPLGQVSGRPLSGDASSIRISNPIYGDVDLNLESAIMLDFQPSTNAIDDWDADF